MNYVIAYVSLVYKHFTLCCNENRVCFLSLIIIAINIALHITGNVYFQIYMSHLVAVFPHVLCHRIRVKRCTLNFITTSYLNN